MLLSTRAYVLICHLTFGLYLFEFITTLPFDWAFWTGKQKWRWSYVPYFGARYGALLAWILLLRITNVLAPIDCQPWLFAFLASSHVSMGFSSVLLLLRVVAVSGRHKVATPVLAVLCLGNWAGLIHGVTMGRGETMLQSDQYLCVFLNANMHLINVAVSFGFDLTCLLVMFLFLVRGHSGGSLWRTLVTQGINYFLTVTTGYLLATVFLKINLNDGINSTVQILLLGAMTMGATRMYRSLFALSSPGAPTASGPHAVNRIIASTRRSTDELKSAASGYMSRELTKSEYTFGTVRESVVMDLV